MIHIGNVFLELHHLMEIGSWGERWGTEIQSHISWQSQFSFASKQRNESYCSNNLEKIVPMYVLEGTAWVTSYFLLSPWSWRVKGTY